MVRVPAGPPPGTPSAPGEGPTFDAPPTDPGHLGLDRPLATSRRHLQLAQRERHTCGVETGKIHFTFTEPFFDLTEYEITVGETSYSKADLSGQTVKVDREIDLTGGPLRVQARAKNSDSRDDWGPPWEQTFDTKCLRDSAVLLAVGLGSSLDADGSTTPRSHCLDRQDGEAFNLTFATNDCDSNDPKGNLVAT